MQLWKASKTHEIKTLVIEIFVSSCCYKKIYTKDMVRTHTKIELEMISQLQSKLSTVTKF